MTEFKSEYDREGNTIHAAFVSQPSQTPDSEDPRSIFNYTQTMEETTRVWHQENPQKSNPL